MPATEIVQNTLILIGVFAFALSGALLAVRRHFDIVGMAVLATVTAVGGGVIRDVLIGDIPPAALTDPWSLLIPLAAAVLTFFFHPRLARMGRTVQLFDAIGLGVFCATATTKAAATGIHPWRRSSSAPSPASAAASCETSWPVRPHPCCARTPGCTPFPRSRVPSWSRWPTHTATATPRSRLLRPQASADSDYSH